MTVFPETKERGCTAQLILSATSMITTKADKKWNYGLASHMNVDTKIKESRVMTKLGLSQECIVLFRFTIYSCILPHLQIQGEKPYDCLNTGIQSAWQKLKTHLEEYEQSQRTLSPTKNTSFPLCCRSWTWFQGFLRGPASKGLPGKEFCNPVDVRVVGGGPKRLWENYRPRAGLRLLKAPHCGKT